jgi:uncharacterized protein YjiS (DUF1127 family)
VTAIEGKNMPAIQTTAVADLTARYKTQDKTQETHSLLQRLCRPFAIALAALRRAAAERRLRDELARMDDALLRDIGITEDEIVRIRARERFTPAAWSDDVGGLPRRGV